MVMIRELSSKSNRLDYRNSLGSGAYRVVHKCGKRYVMKIDGGYSASSNRTECAIWDVVRGTDAEKFFVPILARSADCKIVIQPRIDVLDDIQVRLDDKAEFAQQLRYKGRHSQADRLYQSVQSQYKKIRADRQALLVQLSSLMGDPFGISYNDIHVGNIGYMDGRMVVLDYGNFELDGFSVYNDNENDNSADDVLDVGLCACGCGQRRSQF